MNYLYFKIIPQTKNKNRIMKKQLYSVLLLSKYFID